MKQLSKKMAALVLTPATPGASGQTAAKCLTGAWKVHTEIHGRKTDLVCRFIQTDAALTGHCISDRDNSTLQRRSDGHTVHWFYQTKYFVRMLTTKYAGMLDRSNLDGQVIVAPFVVTGTFAGVRGE